MNESNSWLAMIPDILSLIDEEDCLDPGGKVGSQSKAEKVRGTMSLEEKRLYTYMMRLGKQKYEAEGNAMYITGGNIDERRDEIIKQVEALEAKGSIIQKVMFITIQDRLNLWHTALGVRSDFQIVTWKEVDKPNPLDFLRKLGGLDLGS